jgi:hypothetical protein
MQLTYYGFIPNMKLQQSLTQGRMQRLRDMQVNITETRGSNPVYRELATLQPRDHGIAYDFFRYSKSHIYDSGQP